MMIFLQLSRCINSIQIQEFSDFTPFLSGKVLFTCYSNPILKKLLNLR